VAKACEKVVVGNPHQDGHSGNGSHLAALISIKQCFFGDKDSSYDYRSSDNNLLCVAIVTSGWLCHVDYKEIEKEVS